MSQLVMAVCDSYQEYLRSILRFLQEKAGEHFVLQGFSGEETLREYARNHRVDVLLIAEEEFQKATDWILEAGGGMGMREDRSLIIILQSNPDLPARTPNLVEEESLGYGKDMAKTQVILTVSKYQSAESLYRTIMEACAKYLRLSEQGLGISDAGGMRAGLIRHRAPGFGGSGLETAAFEAGPPVTILGVYSPVRSCLQTTLTLTMGQLLAEQKKTLYLNFECYSGFELAMGKKFGGNMTDLLYFYECARDRLGFRLESIRQELGKLHLIPPAESYEDLDSVDPKQWVSILEGIAGAGGYEVLILDLTEQVRGLFQILERCDRIYTIVREDRMAKAKLAQYSLLLEKQNRTQIAEKTEQCLVPVIHRLPADFEMLCRGELAEYARYVLRQGSFL